MLSLSNAVRTPLYAVRSCALLIAGAMPFLLAGPAAAEGAATPSLKPLPSATEGSSLSPVFAFKTGARYAVTSSPLHVTDIALQPGEELRGEIATGDSIRWIISVDKKDRDQVHVFVKPVKAGLATNLIVRTNRRTYLIELQSVESGTAGMMSVGWTYPNGERTLGDARASNDHH